MGCVNIAPPAPPPLPTPFTIPPFEVPLPGTPELVLCCRLPPFQPKPVPIPIAAQFLLSPAVALAIDTAITAVTKYINDLPLKCPLE